MALTLGGVTSIDAANAVTGWTGSGNFAINLNTTDQVQGTGCIADPVKATGLSGAVFDNGSAIDLTGDTVAFWVRCNSAGLLDTRLNGGIRLQIGSTAANFDEWYVAGSDTYGGGWERFVIDPSKTASSQGGTGLSALTAAQFFGVRFNFLTAFGGNDDNCLVDEISFLSANTITVLGTSTDFWADLLSGSDTNEWGLVRQRGPIYYVRAILQVGGNTTTDIEATGDVVVFEDPQYYNGSTVDSVYSAGSSGIVIQRGTAATDVDFGSQVGVTELGVDGILWASGGTLGYTFLVDDDVDSCNLNGCTIKTAVAGLGSIVHFGDAETVLLSCTLDDCNKIGHTGAEFKNCIISNSQDSSNEAFEWRQSSSIDPDIADCLFLNNSRAITMGTAVVGPESINFDNLRFGGNTFDLKNESANDNTVTINILNGGDVPTIEEVPGSRDTVTVNARLVRIQNLTEGARVHVSALAGGPLSEGTVILTGTVAAGDTFVETTGFDYSANQPCRVRARYSSFSDVQTKYLPFLLDTVITNAGLTLNAVWIEDTIAKKDTILVNIDHDTSTSLTHSTNYDSAVTDSGDLSITVGAALNSTTNGLQAVVDDTNAIYGQKAWTVLSSGHRYYRIRFRYDPNGFAPTFGQVYRIFRLLDSSNLPLIDFEWTNPLQLNCQYYHDTGAATLFNQVSDAEHLIEFQYVRSSGGGAFDGNAELWVDGTSVDTETGRKTETKNQPDKIRAGVMPVSGSATGTTYLDEIIVTDGCSVIG